MGYVAAIDLGATFTAAAVLRDLDLSPEVVSLGSHGAAIATVVHVRDGTVLVGEAAEQRSVDDPEAIARDFKRRLGDSTPIFVAGSPWSAEALLSEVLRWVIARIAEFKRG